MAQGLQELVRLTRTDLTGVPVSAALATTLAALLQLRRLALASFKDSQGDFCAHVGAAFARSTSLSHLDLSQNSPLLEELQMRPLASQMRCAALTHLNLAHCVHDYNAAPLCFAAMPRLVHLDLTGTADDSDLVLSGDEEDDFDQDIEPAT